MTDIMQSDVAEPSPLRDPPPRPLKITSGAAGISACDHELPYPRKLLQHLQSWSAEHNQLSPSFRVGQVEEAALKIDL
jgi:hypothetical protein